MHAFSHLESRCQVEAMLGAETAMVVCFAPSALAPAIETMYENFICRRGLVRFRVIESCDAQRPFGAGGSIRRVRYASL